MNFLWLRLGAGGGGGGDSHYRRTVINADQKFFGASGNDILG